MAKKPNILVFGGATHRASFNKQLARAMADLAQEAGGEATLIDLADYALPLYDGDLEAESGLPENAVALKTLFKAADGLIISTPEYNGSLPAVLKNVVDWVSRPAEGEAQWVCFRGKVLGAVSASPAKFGGMNALGHLRQVMMGLGMLVVPGFTAFPEAASGFDDSGAIANPDQQAMYLGFAKQVVALASGEN